jgi:hypothetical protein
MNQIQNGELGASVIGKDGSIDESKLNSALAGMNLL